MRRPLKTSCYLPLTSNNQSRPVSSETGRLFDLSPAPLLKTRYAGAPTPPPRCGSPLPHAVGEGRFKGGSPLPPNDKCATHGEERRREGPEVRAFSPSPSIGRRGRGRWAFPGIRGQGSDLKS